MRFYTLHAYSMQVATWTHLIRKFAKAYIPLDDVSCEVIHKAMCIPV